MTVNVEHSTAWVKANHKVSSVGKKTFTQQWICGIVKNNIITDTPTSNRTEGPTCHPNSKNRIIDQQGTVWIFVDQQCRGQKRLFGNVVTVWSKYKSDNSRIKSGSPKKALFPVKQ